MKLTCLGQLDNASVTNISTQVTGLTRQFCGLSDTRQQSLATRQALIHRQYRRLLF